MQRTQVEPYVIEQMSVKLADRAGNGIDTVYAENIGVTVEFEYEKGDDEDSPQVYIKAVKSAGAQLQGERTTVDFWPGYDIQGYLVEADLDAIKEEIIKRYDKRKTESREQGRLDALQAARADRDNSWF